jgi:acetylornithine deacetylase/succinyl-diaminopimelate desuccinylase-like protein
MKEYIEQNKERFFEELFSVLRIPSVSAKAAHKDDMRRCAERLAVLLVEAGADEAQVFSTDGNPVVFGSKIIDPKAFVSQSAVIGVYGEGFDHFKVRMKKAETKHETD